MLELLLIFLYIGFFTIGGGMVAIPLIQQQVVDKGFITEELFHKMIAIAESTPGPIGINIATFVGFELHGLLGATLLTVAFILPSFIIVSALAKLIIKYRSSIFVAYWFLYVKVAIVGLIMYTMSKIALSAFMDDNNVIDFKVLGVFSILLIIFYFLRKKPLLVILIGAVLGMIFL